MMIGSESKGADRSALIAGVSGLALIFLTVIETYRDHSYMILIVRYMHLLAFSVVARSVLKTRSTAGISMHSLLAYACAISMRLVAVIPDGSYRSGDSTLEHIIYVITEILALPVLLYLINETRKSRDYRPDCDQINFLLPFTTGLTIGYFLHVDLAGQNYIDWMWMSSMIVESLAIVPQLFMFVKSGEVRPILSHYVMLLMATKTLSFLFWFGYYWIFFNPAYPVLLFCKYLVVVELVNVLVMADFSYLYASSWKKQGFGLPLITSV